MRTVMQKIDDSLTKSVQSLPDSWTWYFRQMTLIGQPVFALLAVAGVAYYGEYIHDWRLMLAGMIAAIATLLGTAFKLVIRRPRPSTVYARSMFFKTYSFPSGHAVATMACYGLVSYLFLASDAIALIILGATLIPTIFSIGLSRVYLGAHYPSDIIGGWILGGLGLSLAIWTLHL